MRNNLGTALALFLLAGRLAAQTESGTIVGTVTDQAGAAVPAVKITLLQKSTGFTRAVATNGSGQYAANSIPTGPYSIVAETPGFEKLVRSGLQLTAAETLTVDLQLTIGSVQETVEVTATGTLVQDQTAVVSNLVTNRQILDMPLNGRAFTSLLLLTPGIYAGSSGNLTTSPYAMRGSTNYSVNGSTPQNNSYLIDGITNRNLWLNTLIIVPTADSIQEFRVMTSNYSAEYGAAAGAVTIVQTKSGTNAYHGTAYEFLRNDKLDANTFFNNRGGLPKAAFHRNEFGATTGGPIQRDKTFFFADYQGILIRQPETLTATIPTLAQRQAVLTGNFTGIASQIFDPATAHPDASGKTVRDPFPNNTIPAGRLDPAALRLIGFLPQPTSPAATRNFTYNPRISQNTDQFDLRLDQNFAQSDRIFFKYSFDNSSKLDPGVLPAPANASIPIAPYLSADGTGTATDISLTNWSTTLNYTKVFGSATVNEARLGVVRWNQYINPLGNAFATASAIGIPGINITDKSGGLPALLVTGFQVIGDNSTYPENSQTVTFDLGDTLTLVRGSHTWKFGASLVRNRFDGFSNFPARGSYDFNGQFTRQIGAAGSQTALADFALGAPDSVNRNILSGTFGMRYYYLSGFGDDTWRITNRLTLNYGLRYELFAPPLEVHDRWSNFNLRTAQLEIAGRNGSGRRLRNFDLQDFGPRLGATYALTRDRKTVLRTGMGISYVEAGKGGGQLYKNLPFFFNQTFPTDQNAAPPLFLRDGLPAPVMPSVNDTAALSTGSPTAWDYSLKSARIFQWSFGLQREIRADLLLDISYVGTRGEHLIGNVNINQSFPGAGAQGPRRPFFNLNPNIVNLGLQTNYGDSKYQALQTRAEKRYSFGLTGTVAYTWSKYISDVGNVNGGGNGPPQDARCFRCERGSQPEDRRHVLVINHVYELPFGAGRKYASHGLLSYLLGPWNLSGIWTVQSGDHFTATIASSLSNSAGGGGDRPNRLSDGNLPSSQRSIDHWFDTAAFVSAPQYQFGNSGRGILVGPRYANLDLGVHRNFRIKEHVRVSYRWEMFNAFNHANFGDPNASIGNAQAGQISGTSAARIMQMALKVEF